MIKRLKQKRLDCGQNIEKDSQALHWLQKDIDNHESRLNSLSARLDDKLARKKQILDLIRLQENHMGVLSADTRARNRATSLEVSRHQKKRATELLTVERGFSTSKDCRPYAEKPGTIRRR